MIKEMKTKGEGGFTLVELLIVIAIIAILAAIAIPQFAQYQERAIRASMQSDAKNIATMEEACFGDFQTYDPTTAAGGLIQGAAYSIGGQPGRTSKNNGLIATAPAGGNTYTIQVYNSAAGTGSKTFSMDNSGGMGFF